jgi:peptidoglycan glycosyltransferase
MLLVVLFLAETKFGAKNWVEIKNTTIQPSEFVKIIFVFCIASMLSKVTKFRHVVYISLLAAAHVIILVLEKDLGAALLFFVTYFVMLYIARKNGLYILLGTGFGTLAAVIAYRIPQFNHVRVRVLAWMDPWSNAAGEGYQVAQSLFAIGTGSWFGLGITKGLPYKIPVRESDFIFSVICEELGVITGIMIILICLSNYIMFINIAMQIKKIFYKLIAVGLSTMYIFQVLLTIGGAVKFIPSTGVTLPFISYGGSSILSSLIVFSVIQGLYVKKASA